MAFSDVSAVTATLLLTAVLSMPRTSNVLVFLLLATHSSDVYYIYRYPHILYRYEAFGHRGLAAEVPKDLLQHHMASAIFYTKTQSSSVTVPSVPTGWEKAPSPRCTGESTTASPAQLRSSRKTC